MDSSACSSVIANDGDIYQMLSDLESKGTDSGHQKAHLDLLTLDSTLSTFDGQVQSSELASALSKIEVDAPQVKSQLLAQQPVAPEPLKTHLVDAAVICQHGGVPISWYSSS